MSVIIDNVLINWECNDCESKFIDDDRAFNHSREEKHCVHDVELDHVGPCNGYCARWDH